jgi:hypothetical protein
MKFLSLAVLVSSLVGFLSCSRPPQASTQSAPVTPEARIQQIPPADPQTYGQVRNMKTWRNPYLIVKTDGIWLLDASNNEEHPLNPDQLLDALSALPPSAWPYGRVVAVQESSMGSSGADRIALRKNRAILAGTLEGAKVLINWVPTA